MSCCLTSRTSKLETRRVGRQEGQARPDDQGGSLRGHFTFSALEPCGTPCARNSCYWSYRINGFRRHEIAVFSIKSQACRCCPLVFASSSQSPFTEGLSKHWYLRVARFNFVTLGACEKCKWNLSNLQKIVGTLFRKSTTGKYALTGGFRSRLPTEPATGDGGIVRLACVEYGERLKRVCHPFPRPACHGTGL